MTPEEIKELNHSKFDAIDKKYRYNKYIQYYNIDEVEITEEIIKNYEEK